MKKAIKDDFILTTAYSIYMAIIMISIIYLPGTFKVLFLFVIFGTGTILGIKMHKSLDLYKNMTMGSIISWFFIIVYGPALLIAYGLHSLMKVPLTEGERKNG